MLAIAAAAAAAGGSYLFSKRPVRTSLCHACGITLEGAGDLCPGCRHEAAEARRRAMAAANH
jgi:tRNA(Ile2) C34 agmatinyltransferase TiaS